MIKIPRILFLLPPVIALLGCGEKQVSYNADVQPVLEKYCMRCHGEGGKGSEASGLRMDDYDRLMKGTKHGPVVIAGDSFTSALVMLVEGRADPALRMPHDDGPAPSAEELGVIKVWINQGAKNN